MKNMLILSGLFIGASCAAFAGGAKEPPPKEYPVREIDETIPARAEGLVTMDTSMGSVNIVGWDREEIRVSGTIGKHLVDFEVTATESGTLLKTILPDRDNLANLDLDCTLEVRIPESSSIRAASLGADVTVRNVRGPKECDSFTGNTTVEGRSGPIHANTIGGDIVITGPVDRVTFRSGTGTVRISGVEAEIMGTTMNGEIHITDSQLADVDISTLTGDIFIDGDLTEGGRLKAVCQLGGSIELTLPFDVTGRFTLSSSRAPDAVDMHAFTPAQPLVWVFDGEPNSPEESDRVGERSDGRLSGSRSAFSVSDSLGDRITFGLRDGMREFTVGDSPARVYLESSSLRSRRSEEDDTSAGIVLKTRPE